MRKGGFMLDVQAMAEVKQSYVIGATSGELEFRAFRFADGNIFFKDGERGLGSVNKEDINLDDKVAVGRGASGEVYYATLRADGRPVAVKAIPISSKPHRDEVERELQFITSHKKFICPHVIMSYGAWWEPAEQSVYMCMDYMSYSVQQVSIFADGLSESLVKDIAVQAILGLQHLHEQRRVIHRDIKPGNMLVAADGTVKISDFGVSKVVATLTASNTYIGTLLFMAPERLDESDYSFPSDVWSMGLSLISIATGKQPWHPPEELNVYQLLARMSDGAVPTLPEGFTPLAQDFVAQCLNRDPNTRPSCTQLLEHPWLASRDTNAARGNVKLFVEQMTRLVQQGAKMNNNTKKTDSEVAAEKEQLVASSLDQLLGV